jgi:sulfoxide reductase heme-binding subunit YedZ
MAFLFSRMILSEKSATFRDHAVNAHAGWPRLPPEKAAAFIIAVAPAVLLAGLAYDGELGVRPVHEAIRESGDWALRLLWLTLLVSPARRILAAPRLIRARRTLGLGAFGLTTLHIGLYALELQFDWAQIGLEIVLRLYLTVGAVSTIVLAALAATSTDRAIARLGGRRWNRLHQLVYVAAPLAAVHFLLRSRTNTFEPMLMFGLFAWLIGVRLIHRWTRRLTAGQLAGLAVTCAVLTAAAEIAWHAAATGIDPWRLLAADFDFADGLRPAWWVLIAGAAAAAVGQAAAPYYSVSLHTLWRVARNLIVQFNRKARRASASYLKAHADASRPMSGRSRSCRD